MPSFGPTLTFPSTLKAGTSCRRSFLTLNPSTRSVSIRLPEYLLARIKERANFEDMPYQSLIKKTLIRQFAAAQP